MFARLESIFRAQNFTVELVQKGGVMVTDRSFTPPVQHTTGVTGQMQSTGQREIQKATQPVEAPGAVIATRAF